MPTKFQLRLTYPPDVIEAYESWGASCGPCSIAAILGASVNEVRDYLENIDTRKYMNILHVKAALELACVRSWSIGTRLPKLGLVFIQWGGHEHKPIRVQYQYTHWIAIEGQQVFEVNAPELVTWQEWQQVMPRIMQQEWKGNGTFHIRAGIEVRLKP